MLPVSVLLIANSVIKSTRSTTVTKISMQTIVTIAGGVEPAESSTIAGSAKGYSTRGSCEVTGPLWHRHVFQSIVHSKKTDPWGVFDFFQMFWKVFQFSLFQCLKAAFVLLTFQFQVCSALGNNFPFFARKSVVLPFRPQASVRCRCASYIYQTYQRRAKASRRWLCTATALWCDAERTTAKNPRCAGIKENSSFFSFVKADVLFLDALLLCLFGGERQDSVLRPFLASSPLSVAKVDHRFLKSVTVYRTTLPWKITAMKPENAQ